MDKKKNNYNTYSSRDNVFDVDYLDRQNIVLGKAGSYEIDDYDDTFSSKAKRRTSFQDAEDLAYINDVTEYDEMESIIGKLDGLSIFHVNMSYYPFYSQSSEVNYKINYLDPDNVDIKKCPACKYEYNKKVYVIANVVLMCSSCYNSERIIY